MEDWDVKVLDSQPELAIPEYFVHVLLFLVVWHHGVLVPNLAC